MTDASPPTRWVAGMKSPNPAGRPKGSLSKRDKVAQALNEDGPQVARVVIEAALAGDMTAANIVLARITPPLKAQAERVEFTLDPDVPLSEQAAQILLAVSEGKLDAETARTLIGCIESVGRVRAVEDLEARIVLLEARPI